MLSPFGVRDDQRVALFIDGPSFYFATVKRLGWMADFGRLRKHFDDVSMLYRAMYFGLLPENTEDYNSLFKLTEWLSYNQWRTILKYAPQPYPDQQDRPTWNQIEVAIAVEMIEAVPFADHLVVFTGNPNLAYAIDAVQRKGAKVTVVSTTGVIASELRRAADNFIDLADPAIRTLLYRGEVSREAPAVVIENIQRLPKHG